MTNSQHYELNQQSDESTVMMRLIIPYSSYRPSLLWQIKYLPSSLAPLFKYIVFACIFLILSACSSTSPPTSGSSAAVQLDPRYRETLVANAMMLMGTPYRYGGNHPGEGFDCSGFVRYTVAETAKASLPRTTRDIAGATRKIKTSSLKRGDFVFFNTSGPYTHMGIYLGDRKFVHAPSSRNQGAVRIDSMDSKYFSKRFMEARTAFR